MVALVVSSNSTPRRETACIRPKLVALKQLYITIKIIAKNIKKKVYS
jgi:hypothetical protein